MAVTDSLLKTYADADGLELGGMVNRGEVSPAELVECAATLIDSLNPELNAVVHRLYDMSMTDFDAYNAKWHDAVFMFPFNFSGLPAISLPLGWSADGVPMGVQLVGRHGNEATVLAASGVLEQAMPWKDKRPPISA